MKTDKDKLISGTYIHPDLVPSVAFWISSEFQIKANRVVNGYVTRQYNEQLDILKHQNCSLQQMITAKDSIIETAGQEHIEQLKTIEGMNVTVQEKEKDIKAKKRQYDVWAGTHAFTMMRLNNPKARFLLYAIRRKRTSMSRAVKRLRVQHPHSIMIYQYNTVPNPVNLYNRLKASKVLECKANYCRSKISEADLIAKLGKLYCV